MERAPRPRRRQPEAARQEITDAARRLFLERPAQEVTVRTVMAATTLARSSFYEYFDHRAAVIMELVEPVIERNRSVLELWPVAPADPGAAARSLAVALVDAWRAHGRLLLALVDAARTDADADAALSRFSDDSVATVAAKLRLEIDAGTISELDPEQTAIALVLMNRSYLTAQMFRPDPEPDHTLADTLAKIWVRVLWPGP